MRSHRLRWLWRVGLAAGLAFGMGWLPYQVYSRTSIARLVQMRGEVAALRRENAEIREQNARLRSAVGLHVEDEATAVERVARDEMGMVKPGEVVYRVER